MIEFDYLEVVRLSVPQILLVLGALVVLALDLTAFRDGDGAQRSRVAGGLSALFCVGGIAWLRAVQPVGELPAGMLVADPANGLTQQVVLALAALSFLVSRADRFTAHVGEYFAILLMASAGMLFLVATENLLLLFIALELLSLSLYAVVGFNKQNRHGAEAALKYFFFGGMSAAFTLFGFSLLYGISGSLQLPEIAAALGRHVGDPLLLIALLMTLTGFGFKVAVVPFHLWAPDVYEAAPTPAAAFLATGSKVAGFMILGKVAALGLATAAGAAVWREWSAGWQPVVAIFALASMVIGNLVALTQTSLKRLLAYSAIAHGGYALLGVLAQSGPGLNALLYYVATYGLATLGAFAVVSELEHETGNDRIDSLAGFGKRSPVLSAALLVFVLSLAGIPPLAGFFGKLFVFAAALADSGNGPSLLWLVIVGLLFSAVSLYYYLKVLKQVYVVPGDESLASTPIKHDPVVLVVIVILALLVIALGVAPAPLLEAADFALSAAAGS